MLLRIVDKSEHSAAAESVPCAYSESVAGAPAHRAEPVEISVETRTGVTRFVTDFDLASIPTDLRQTLDWYFTEYPHAATAQPDDHGIAAKLTELGQAIGNQLLGEQPQFAQAIAAIQKQGIQQLTVRIESTRASFLAQPWEWLVLPASSQVLSTIVKSFEKRFTGGRFSESDTELEYNLKVTPPVPDAIAELNQQMGNSAPTQAAAEKPYHAPLCILHIVSRAYSEYLPFASSAALEAATDSFCSEGAIHYEIFVAGTWAQLQKRLSDSQRPVHIVQYDGPLVVEGTATGRGQNTGAACSELLSLLLEDAGTTFVPIAFADFTKVLVQNKIAVLCLDARGYFKGSQLLDAAAGLSAAAHAAHHAGLGNLIGLAQITDPWTSGQCFQAIYHRLTAGLRLGQAVTQARQRLQAQTEIARFTSQGLPFQSWPLLVHYGGQTITFFDTPQARVSLSESQTLAHARKRLLGFKATLLSPLLNHASDGPALALLAALETSPQALLLTGPAGSGKTHLVHRLALYLAQREHINFAFYFDFSDDFYAVDMMLEMIAPVLGLAPSQQAETKAALNQLRCCFVLDGLAPDLLATQQTLSGFVHELLANGHLVLITAPCWQDRSPSAFTEIPLVPLLAAEQRLLAAAQLRANTLVGKDLDHDWPALLMATQGNPFLLQHALPLLNHLTVTALTTELSARIAHDRSVVDSFYAWQWSEMPHQWQDLLLLSAEVDGLLLELLMVAFDQKEPFAPAKKLMALTGNEAAVFSDGLTLWQQCGFLVSLPHGRIIDTRCRPFLERKRHEQTERAVTAIESELYFSQVLCEGIRILSRHLNGQQNPTLAHYLLMHRRDWSTHLEKLWFAQDYRGFLSAKHAFDQVLRQAQLGAESAAWSLNLLARSPAVQVDDESEPEAPLAWLALALDAMAANHAAHQASLANGAERWQAWLDALPAIIEKQQILYFQQAATFLDVFYQSRQDWTAALAVNERAVQVYTQYEAWPKAIQALKALARCYLELGEAEQALICEDKILNEISYAGAPPGFHAQQVFDVACARVARGSSSYAQVTLDQLKAMDESKRFGDMLDGLQADIDYQQENYAASMPYYCKLWARAIQAGQQPYIEQLRQKFLQIEQKLGAEVFAQYLDDELEENIVRPQEYIATPRTIH
ncbi:ATP-binding protein [Mycoavidus sp. SF9855]|uniref:ATP-binding protein n=1 Tax=Mycoavidus sp. SF9855 TaxID=2968475 RepID=UPI00211CEEDF|nr:ATP-binding protein [Mycoavidus sp. SF9855]UUM20745.1 ATP-binding protein [Mycoavidus sp. SF9855]